MDWGTELWVSPLPPAPTVLPCWGPGLSALCPRCTFAGTPRFPLQLIPWVPALCPQHSLSKVPLGLSRCPEGPRDTLLRAGLGKLRHRVENEAITRSPWTRPGRGGQLGEVTYFERSGLAWRLILRPLGPCPSLAFPAGRGRVPFGHLLSHVGPHPVDSPTAPRLQLPLRAWVAEGEGKGGCRTWPQALGGATPYPPLNLTQEALEVSLNLRTIDPSSFWRRWSLRV